MLVPFTKVAGVTVASPPSTFIEIIFICPSVPFANEKACAPVVVSNVTVSVKFMTSVLPEPVRFCTPWIVPEAVKTPVTSTSSAIVIFVESELSSVVPFTLTALNKTSPVPLGWILMSAFDPFDDMTFVVRLFAAVSYTHLRAHET